jgi:hypothetical protein
MCRAFCFLGALQILSFVQHVSLHRYGAKVVPIPVIGNIDFASCRFGIVSGGDQVESVCSPVAFETVLAREEILHGEFPTGLLF